MTEYKIKDNERNRQIYLEKTGKVAVTDRLPTNTPVTYRELSKKYDLSINWVLSIVNEMRKIYGKS